ncbi:MAG: UDP-N-acetylmuramoyl-L-alanyl-D-glutamate--2,6-diaminopimelate ligase [Rikenellaceae bacterium]|jgi:UDP-N-acetylmuramoyl-L-alanyl-D-glutamate--2,6-diaminopimelate ligase|nr:UDP-N-acetylmuramoyl-L-alanyl-D-glutamate--2,6-diaminopimelate ligase [Rikenellaceae bacterium]
MNTNQSLGALLQGLEIEAVRGSLERPVSGIDMDSRQVQAGTLFVALRGTQSDGHAYIAGAIARGATAILCEALPEEIEPAVTYVQVADTQAALGVLAANFYDRPSEKLRLVGVTGTNGKTTTASLLYEMFRRLGYKVGLISTVIYRVDDRSIASTHTTPDAISLNRLLAEMVEAGCAYCFMEVSSHSIVQHRIDGLHFAGGIFTNLTHDHLDYHATFANYRDAKKAFFDCLPKGAFALVNIDDKNGRVMTQNTRAAVRSYALKSFADFKCRILESHFDGMLLDIDSQEVWVHFLGRFNAYNLLAVYATALLLDQERQQVLTVLSELVPVSGRFEFVRSAEGVTAIVDYAHTPDALDNVLATINEIRRPEQKLYTVVGCGGDRDREKRPVMARIAGEKSDIAVLTSDNPRFEKPEDILDEMKAGLDPTMKALVITDRREAIKTAVALAQPGDIILVAGKGHEDYQIIAGVKHHFDDKEELRNLFGLN